MRLGLFSVSYGGLWGQAKLSVIDFIKKAKKLGYDEVLLMAKRPHISIIDVDSKMIQAIKSTLKKHSVKCIGLACYNDILLNAPAEVPILEMQISYLEQCFKICNELGGRIVRVFTGYIGKNTDTYKVNNTVITFLREIGERAKKYGIVLAVQNHHDFAVDTRAMLLLLKEVGLANVKAGFDAWSPFLRGEDILEDARYMAPHTALTIAANYIKIPRYTYLPEVVNYRREYPDLVQAVPIDEGEIDYHSFVKMLAQYGYDGPVVYEMCSPLIGGGSMQNLDLYAKKFISFFTK